MTTQHFNSNITDPIDSLVEYTLRIKPYHTKIIDVISEYVYEENVKVSVYDSLFTEAKLLFPGPYNTNYPACRDGFATRPFGDPLRFTIASPDSTVRFEDFPAINHIDNYFTAVGNLESLVKIGDTLHIDSYVELNSLDPTNSTQPPSVFLANNVGTYTVTEVEYIPSHKSSTLEGYTKITVNEQLFDPHQALPADPNYEIIYTASFYINPITYKAIMPYSKAHTPTPDEGLNILEIVNIGLNYLTVLGNKAASTILPGQSVVVTGTDQNDGTYVVDTVTYDNVNKTSNIYITQQTLTPSTSNVGNVITNVLADVFIVEGDVTSRFIPGYQFIVQGGNTPGKYKTLKSGLTDQGDTWIRVTNDIINRNNGLTVISYGAYSVIVQGDLTSHSPEFIVISGSEMNDGFYEITNFQYDVSTNATTLTVNVKLVPNSTGGVCNVIRFGTIIDRNGLGFAESTYWCGTVPETFVHVNIDEKLEFGGLGIDLTDDINVYNIEDTNGRGLGLPYTTIVSSTEPIVTFSQTPPVGVFGNIWFDTVENVTKVYYGNMWLTVPKLWWIDEYDIIRTRVINKIYDTGWYIESVNDTESQFNYGNKRQYLFRDISILQSNCLSISGGNFVDLFTFRPLIQEWTLGSNDVSIEGRHNRIELLTIPITKIDYTNNLIYLSGDYTSLPDNYEFIMYHRDGTYEQLTGINKSYDQGTNETVLYLINVPNQPLEQFNPDGSIIPPETNEGVVLGAFYDSTVNADRTLIFTKTPVTPPTNAISVITAAPLTFKITTNQQDTNSTNIYDGINASNDLLNVPDRYKIITIDTISNFITIKFEETYTGIDSSGNVVVYTKPVDLTSVFPPGSFITIRDSENDDGSLSNNYTYMVDNVVWDYDPNTNIGSGETVLYISTNLSEYPPSITFQATYNPANNTLDIIGDVAKYFDINQSYRADIPLTSTNVDSNVITPVVVENFNGFTRIKFDEQLKEAPTFGSFTFNITEANYRQYVLYNNDNVTNWRGNGYIEREVLTVDQASSVVTAAVIDDKLFFGWGGTYRWDIIYLNPSNNEIILNGDLSNAISVNDECNIIGGTVNDGNYTVVNVVYNGASDITVLTLRNIPLQLPNIITENVTILSASPSSNYFIVDGGEGKHAEFLRSGTQFVVSGSIDNNGTYTIYNTIYDKVTDRLTVIVNENVNSNSGSGSVQYDRQLAGIAEFVNLDIVEFFQNTIRSIDGNAQTITVFGTLLGKVQIGQQIRITGALNQNNDKVFTVSNVAHPDQYSSVITTIEPILTQNEVGGWVESARDFGMSVSFEDAIVGSIAETAKSIVLTSGGSLMNSLDYNGFDVGRFNEDPMVTHLADNN